MKIFAVVRNYGDCNVESPFGNGDATWYEVPDSSLLRSGQPFFVPDFAREFRAFPSVIYRISRLGKGIARRFASRYIDAATMGCAAVAVDLLRECRKTGEPWCRAVAFDKCCMLGKFIPIDGFPERWHVGCGEYELTYETGDMRHDMADVLELISRDITVKEGDMIVAAVHPSGLPLNVGTKLSVFPADDYEHVNKVIDINIR